MRFEYPSKIILAWGEAISGNVEIRTWLTKNGYPELGIFCFAINNKRDAKKWLLDNDFQHLRALIDGSEGEVKAIVWLRKNKFPILEKMALAADNNDDAYQWLLLKGHPDFANLAKRIRQIKNIQQFENTGMHKMSPD